MNGLREQLVEFSRRYGGDERYVLAGGGNTSCKADGILHVKASGTQLATINGDGFVQMDIPKLLAMLEKDYPQDDAAREQAALQDMTAALLPGQQGKRPSVECLLHALFPYTFVLHLHPALVNGLTCAVDGEAACAALFGGEAVWVPLTKPGYVLAKACHDAFTTYQAAHGAKPKLLFMQNHGLIAAADTVAELDRLMETVMDRIGGKIQAEPDLTPLEAPPGAAKLGETLRGLYANAASGGACVFHTSPTVAQYVQNQDTLQPLLLPFNPDQIVYCKGAFLVLHANEDAAPAFAAFVERNGYAPKIAIVMGVGLFALGAARQEADIALALFLDAIKIACYAAAFGGPLPLTRAFTDFILNWEVENYRQKVSLAAK